MYRNVAQSLRVPLNGGTNVCSGSSIASIVPSGAHAQARRPRPRRSTAWWWNELTFSSVVPSTEASVLPGATTTG